MRTTSDELLHYLAVPDVCNNTGALDALLHAADSLGEIGHAEKVSDKGPQTAHKHDALRPLAVLRDEETRLAHGAGVLGRVAGDTAHGVEPDLAMKEEGELLELPQRRWNERLATALAIVLLHKRLERGLGEVEAKQHLKAGEHVVPQRWRVGVALLDAPRE